MQKPSYVSSFVKMTKETLSHPVRSLNLMKSIPALCLGLSLVIGGLLTVINALCSIVFRCTLLIASPLTFPILAIIYHMNEQAEYEAHKEMLREGKLSPEEEAELGVG